MRRLGIVVPALLVAGLVTFPAARSSAGGTGYAVQRGEIRIKDSRTLSTGASMWFLGPQGSQRSATFLPSGPSFGTNVDAANPNEDVAGGQSETAVAADGDNIVATWNDANGFFFKDSTLPEAQATGVGISNDGGASFTDYGGLHNPDPNQQWFGDPSVVTIDHDHFIASSFWLPSNNATDFCASRITMAVEVITIDSGGTVTFGNPLVAVDGGSPCDASSFFPDKDFLAYDPVSRTLAMSYTDFKYAPPTNFGNGQIELVRATVPANPTKLSRSDWSAPIVVSPERGSSSNSIYQEGAYPAVAPGGDIYLAWEKNWISGLFNGDPHVYLLAAEVPSGSSTVSKHVVLTINQTNATSSGGVRSLSFAVIPGYNRGLGNDFPRVVWNTAADKLDVVWNDASQHFLGDIFLKSLPPGLIHNSTASIAKINDDSSYALHFLPGLSIRSDGSICTSWYDRRNYGSTSALTDYFGECRSDAKTPATDFQITTGPTDWTNTNSIIIPNFGDYTDNTSTGTTTYYLWADGRVGAPQPFADSNP